MSVDYRIKPVIVLFEREANTLSKKYPIQKVVPYADEKKFIKEFMEEKKDRHLLTHRGSQFNVINSTFYDIQKFVYNELHIPFKKLSKIVFYHSRKVGNSYLRLHRFPPGGNLIFDMRKKLLDLLLFNQRISSRRGFNQLYVFVELYKTPPQQLSEFSQRYLLTQEINRTATLPQGSYLAGRRRARSSENLALYLLYLYSQIWDDEHPYEDMEDVKVTVKKDALENSIAYGYYLDIEDEEEEKEEKKSKKKTSKKEKKKCAICQDEFRAKEITATLRNCEHMFHKICIEKWLVEYNHKCPLCRKSAKMIHKEISVKNTTK